MSRGLPVYKKAPRAEPLAALRGGFSAKGTGCAAVLHRRKKMRQPGGCRIRWISGSVRRAGTARISVYFFFSSFSRPSMRASLVRMRLNRLVAYSG